MITVPRMRWWYTVRVLQATSDADAEDALLMAAIDILLRGLEDDCH